jgi:minor extracellular serine protease Vpr
MFRRASRICVFLLVITLTLPGGIAAQAGNPTQLRLSDRQVTIESAYEITDLDAAIQTDDGRVRIIVELEDAPVAQYQGEIAGLPATSLEATGQQKLDASSAASIAYINYLLVKQQFFTTNLARVAPSAQVDHRYQVAFNGLSLAVEPAEVSRIAKMAGVRRIYPDQLRTIEMDASNELINSPALWAQLGGQQNAGAGIIVAVIDTGIRPENPMFSGEGFSMPPGYPKGYCASNPGDPDFQCNAKVIAARYYTPTFSVHPDEVLSPLDIDGHGSHTAGSAAGNPVEVNEPSIAPAGTQISGVAPAAHIMVYKGFYLTPTGGGSGSDSMLLAALNDALADGANVINNSWGGGVGSDPASSVYLTTIQSIVSSGVVVVFSAGNSGPDGNTIGCPSCIEETISVAASTTGRRFAQTLDILGPGAVPDSLKGIIIKAGTGPRLTAPLTAPLEYAGEISPGNSEGCNAFPAGSLADAIVLIRRRSCTFETKVNHASTAGAVAALIYNNQGDQLISMSVGATTIPSYFMGQTHGEAIRSWITSQAGVSAMIHLASTRFEVIPDVVADFSSSGPNGDPDVLKPDIVAPGVDILSAYSPALAGLNFNQISGTSMAAPHITGAVALLKQLHPFWTPAQIKTALTSTAVQSGVLKPDGLTLADPFNVGAGRVDLDRARRAGLTFDKPSLAEDGCLMNCSWTRAIQNVSGDATTWTARVVAPEGLEIEVHPATLTLGPNRVSTFLVNADVTVVEQGQWYFGAIIWSEAGGNHPDAYLPLAVAPAASSHLGSLATKVDKTMALPGDSLLYTTTLANKFPEAVSFDIRNPVPQNATFITGSATGGLAYDASQQALVGEVSLPGLAVEVLTAESPYGFFPLASGIGGVSLCALFSGCDEAIVNLTLDTPFEYLGQTYDKLGLVSNGYLIPGGGELSDVTFNNQRLPDPAMPNNVIAPLWTDLDMDGSAADDPGGGTWTIAVLEDGSDEFLVVEWEDAQQYGDATTTYTFQVWIQLGTSKVWFVYEDLPGDLAAYGLTVGAEDAGGETGATYYYNPNDLGAPPEGIAPQAGSDLTVESLASTASFTFSLLVDSLADLAEGQGVITNIVQARNDRNGEIMTAWTATAIQTTNAYLPLVMRSP